MIDTLSEQRAKSFSRHRARVNGHIDDWNRYASAIFKTLR